MRSTLITHLVCFTSGRFFLEFCRFLCANLLSDFERVLVVVVTTFTGREIVANVVIPAS